MKQPCTPSRQWIDLCLWAPAMEPIGRQLTIRHITRDEGAIEALERALGMGVL